MQSNVNQVLPYRPAKPDVDHRTIQAHSLGLPGCLDVPANAAGVVLLVNQPQPEKLSLWEDVLVRRLNGHGIATLTFESIFPEESEHAAGSVALPLVGYRLLDIIRNVETLPQVNGLPLGLLGLGRGASAAMLAAALMPDKVAALSLINFEPDLLPVKTSRIRCPTDFIVSAASRWLVDANECAYNGLDAEKALHLVVGATQALAEPDALQTAGNYVCSWFKRYLGATMSTKSMSFANVVPMVRPR